MNSTVHAQIIEEGHHRRIQEFILYSVNCHSGQIKGTKQFKFCSSRHEDVEKVCERILKSFLLNLGVYFLYGRYVLWVKKFEIMESIEATVKQQSHPQV